MFTRLGVRPFLPGAFCLTGLLLFFMACTGAVQPPEKSHGFLDHLFSLKGKKLAGMIIFPSGKEAPFKGESIWLEVKTTGRKEFRLPIYRNQRVYRTLILGQDAQGIFLQHENKTADGVQAEISLYGGHSEGPTSPFVLVFPADSYSKQLLGSLRESAWSLAFNNDRSVLSYIAEENGHVTLQIDFDLTGENDQEVINMESLIDLPRKAFKNSPAQAWQPACLRQQ
jgi:hypothetical protein